MAPIYLHDHKSFPELLRIIEEEKDIPLGLVEKDYWIMHALYGLKKQGYAFQLKGGTSLFPHFAILALVRINHPVTVRYQEHIGINRKTA